MFGRFEGWHFVSCACGAALEVCLREEGAVHLSLKDGNTESLESEWISFCWRTDTAKLVRAEGGSYLAWVAQWGVRGVAERMLKPVPLGRCLPPKADLRLFRGRSGGEGEYRWA